MKPFKKINLFLFLTILGLMLVILSLRPNILSQEGIQPKVIYLMLSVDWEGDRLHSENLEAMQKFNERFPQYPILHFINAAYYTKPEALSAEETTKRIRSVIKSNDELGLHIHSWESLVRKAGVTPKTGPSFWGKDTLPRGADQGDDIPLNIYSDDEISAIVATSLEILDAQGLSARSAFRGGGWMSGPQVHKALLDNQITADSSAVPPSLINNLYPETQLAQWVQDQWPHVTPISGPYFEKEGFVQFPNNMALADYVDSDQAFAMYQESLEAAQKSGRKWVYLHFGWHQESAVSHLQHDKSGGRKEVRGEYLKRVEETLRRIQAHANQHGHQVRPVGVRTFPKNLIREKP